MTLRPAPRLFASLLLLLAWLLAAPPPGRAAEGQDGCAGFVDSLPATISTQGVWCLRHDLGTAIATGSAILVENNNVTIDCNDFKVGGLAAGTGSTTIGIEARYRSNITVRNCNLRGFQMGISLVGGGGHRVEGNRFDNNLVRSIQLYQVGSSLVRGNRVFDTGGWADDGHRYGILCTVEGNGSCDVVDNAIDGIFALDGNANSLRAIMVGGVGSRVAGNSVRGFVPGTAGSAWGIINSGGSAFFDDNEVTLPTGGAGAYPFACADAALRGNTSWNASSQPPAACVDDGGNAAH